MLKVNGDLINRVLPALGKNCVNKAIEYIHIEDVDDKRIYVATDGRVLFKTWENIPHDSKKLTQAVDLKINKKIKVGKINPYFTLEVVDNKGFLSTGSEIVGCEISIWTYPDYEKCIPKKNKITNKWVLFDVDLLLKVRTFLNFRLCLPAPYSEGLSSPAIWEKENSLAVLMPCRYAE